ATRAYVQPYWGWGGWGRGSWPPRQSAPTEIANGETTTDETGVISLSFVASPDLSIARTTNPTFTFEVTFDVTDRAGETRSTTQSLQIGYTALQASLNIPEQVEKGDAKTYAVKATNQAGVPVTIRQGEVVILRLQAPSQPLRKRLWERPDRQLLTQAEFKKLFPNDVYADEDNPQNWTRERVLTAQPQAVLLRDLAPGEYVAETTVTDLTGEKATQRQFFSVVDERTASQRPDSWVRATKTELEPGAEAIFFVGNTQPGWVLMTVEEKNQPSHSEWVKTDGTPKRVAIPVTEKQRGGFVVEFAVVQQGRLLTETRPIQVPFTNKKLTIETLTFRDKLKPGQADEWIIRISGPDKDKVVAEMVAALYDASLDEFVPHQWQASIYQNYQGGRHQWQSSAFSQIQANQLFYRWQQRNGPTALQYPLLLSGLEYGRNRGGMARMSAKRADYAGEGAAAPMAMAAEGKAETGVQQDAMALNEVVTVGYGGPKKPPIQTTAQPILRKNFNETAFFFPQLQTDAEGRVLLKFTMPDALTRWKLLTFAHTKDLKTGLLTREIVTQKELMVTLNPPRFLREQDTIQLSARINNLMGNALSGTAKLEAFDAMTDQPISASAGISVTLVPFSAGPNGSASATWTVTVPTGLPPVAFRVSATSGSFTDAEERVVPVLPNRMLVTDALPFWVNGNETRTFNLSVLTGLAPNAPVQHERLTVEVTSNPAWAALQSLPYLMEYPYECAEQIASRLYANYLASSLIDSSPTPGRPEFRRVIDGWAVNPPKSPLTTNAELKAVTLENSPWLAEAKSETERTARLGQLFDKNRLANEQRVAVDKLRQLQNGNGGFSWFSGMEPNLTMTLHILTVMGRMQQVASVPGSVQPAVDLSDIRTKAVQYVDAEMKRWVAEHQKTKNPYPSAYLPIQYLYARTLGTTPALDKAVVAYLQKLIVKEWLTENLQGQVLAVMALTRTGDQKTARAILASLKERAKTSDELGMYWPQNQPGYYWYQAPVETQAYLIEAFGVIGQDEVAVQDMKKWLLRQKQTQSWPSTKATTEAVNALLQGPNGKIGQTLWLATGINTEVLVGSQSLTARIGKEATTPLGYQKTTYNPAEIKPELGKVQISKKSDTGPAWGALYWQRFEPLDKIKSGSTSLSVEKTLFVQRDTPNGPVIEPLTAKTILKPGALLKVRLVIKNDRQMEYVHLKESRASGFEPVAVLSAYKYRNGLGYYEAPRDASTDFFIGALSIGTHVFEYDLRVVQPGDFSAGVATIQCFYAPEFSAHSTGIRVKVK
ncbi:MAG: alpha-2-macroglobulin, partial [Rudanella sp.]|nr:alpha-2-macroglobulin [Rudanella sp.]